MCVRLNGPATLIDEPRTFEQPRSIAVCFNGGRHETYWDNKRREYPKKCHFLIFKMLQFIHFTWMNV